MRPDSCRTMGHRSVRSQKIGKHIVLLQGTNDSYLDRKSLRSPPASGPGIPSVSLSEKVSSPSRFPNRFLKGDIIIEKTGSPRAVRRLEQAVKIRSVEPVREINDIDSRFDLHAVAIKKPAMSPRPSSTMPHKRSKPVRLSVYRDATHFPR